ncbi:MAG TPA: hypothetical protein VKG63_11200 [Steroidobacteraceae bacterium]|nr:hypothetical protein [Steroidobacteraceae bacterium]
MQHLNIPKLSAAVLTLGLAALVSQRAAADEVNLWDGQLHFTATLYGWVPFIYSTVNLPAIAGGGTETVETQPSQYLKYVKMGALFDGAIQKGDWGLWTDFVFLNLGTTVTHTRQIGLPGGDPLLAVNREVDTAVRVAIWSLAPSYTVVHNDSGSLDVMAGLRYTSARLSLAYEFTAPPTNLMVGGGFWPTRDSTEGLFGAKGRLNLSSDGKWYLPYLVDIGEGNKNWQWEAFLGAGYHFHWGDVTLGARNLEYRTTDNQVIFNKVRFTGPVFGASFHW